jgi:Yippee zinc-binding/DNA-binding /Mis18, centromere assembly
MQIFEHFFPPDVDNCLIQTSVRVSRKSIDLDCRYRNLECCVCHETVGHQYCKAAKKLPHLIGLNAINLSAITMLVILILSMYE